MWHATILTLFPECFPGVLGSSIIGKALNKKIWSYDLVAIRNFGIGRYQQVDDTPAGGGAGLVLRPDVLGNAIDSIHNTGRPFIYLSPRGKPFNQSIARQWSAQKGVILLCGRYEGVDQRILDHYNFTEISLGDFVLCGGEVAAMAMLEASIRLLPGVVGECASLEEESFSHDLLEYPHYTRPSCWQNKSIPDILLSGHHHNIHEWRKEQSYAITRRNRPDLWEYYQSKNKK